MNHNLIFSSVVVFHFIHDVSRLQRQAPSTGLNSSPGLQTPGILNEELLPKLFENKNLALFISRVITLHVLRV